MKKCGILMPIFSLPGNYGIGDFGLNAYKFIDELKEAKVKIWQILPLNPLGFGNSPYQAFSSKAIDEIYVDLDSLYEMKLIKKPKNIKYEKYINYDLVRQIKRDYLKEAFQNFRINIEFKKFALQHWVQGYAKFKVQKNINDMKCWNEWTRNDYTDKDINFEIFIQFILYQQWIKLKKYANDSKIKIMGDLPFYVGYDSYEVYSSPEQFELDENKCPIFIAGVPPDAFSEDGQRWGNPLYDWDYMSKDHYSFWLDRLSYSSKLYDILRIDHFRAFDSYWKIDASQPGAKCGYWAYPNSYEFFDTLFNKLKKINIVVEDLGDLRPEVGVLRDHYNLMGMKVLQFHVFNDDFLENNHVLLYTGTHDNQTLRSWYSDLDSYSKRILNKKLKKSDLNQNFRLIEYALSSNAEVVIIPLFDILNLKDEARLNKPSTVGGINWRYRLRNDTKVVKELEVLKQLIIKYKR